MTISIEAIYEDGVLRLLEPLALAEHSRVRIAVESPVLDAERAAWLEQSERRLREVWENDPDDAYNALLTP
jgi:predicted DNA-binding antitoxin AbrB/MazE fold protein